MTGRAKQAGRDSGRSFRGCHLAYIMDNILLEIHLPEREIL